MKAKDKAKELVEKFLEYTDEAYEYKYAKQCALICVKNEYHEKRELLFLLKSNGHDIKQYSKWIQKLIDEEEEVKQAIVEI